MACSERVPRKPARAHLRHLKGDLAHTGKHRLGLVAIGVVHALGASLIGGGLQVLGTLDAGGLIDQDAQGLASAIKAVGQQAGKGFVQRIAGVVKLSSLGHDEYVLSVSI